MQEFPLSFEEGCLILESSKFTWDDVQAFLLTSVWNEVTKECLTHIIDDGSKRFLRPEQLLQFRSLRYIEQPIQVRGERDISLLGEIIRKPAFRGAYINLESLEISLNPMDVILTLLRDYVESHKDRRELHLIFDFGAKYIIEITQNRVFIPHYFRFLRGFLPHLDALLPLRELIIPLSEDLFPDILSLSRVKKITFIEPNFAIEEEDFPLFWSNNLEKLLLLLPHLEILAFYFEDMDYIPGEEWRNRMSEDFLLAFKDYTYPQITSLDIPIHPVYLEEIKEIFPNLDSPLLDTLRPDETESMYLRDLMQAAPLYSNFRLIDGERENYPEELPVPLEKDDAY